MKIYSKDEAKSEITRLVDDFGKNIDFYKSDKYKEANLEDEYLKPFLRYLNWNVSNEGITNIANREVIVQAKGKRGKEPDYLLQLEGKPKFYIEAKHPKYKLFKEIGYIWQAYSYAYSTQASTERKKVDFSLLTDFEEFRFFDCTFKADKNTVNNFAALDWKFNQYETEFDTLWNLFEKENIRKGSLQSLYLSEKKVKENRIPPDKAFLNDLDNEKTGWRIQIAKEIKKYNPGFSAEYITRAVQLIIDRFIFIKVLSDREIEDDYLSEIILNIDKALIKSEDGLLIDSCKEVFAKLNRVYNGSIFAPKPELESIHISNKVLKNVLSDFLPENSRYNFKQLPVEVLGTIYEQFLGKVIETTEKRVSVEYKPEVRKAGGVYYTPQYIVEYIVENTVGEKLKECKTVDDVFSIKICDPACGSGSFLIGAYDRLVRWCTDYYTKAIKPGAAISKKNAEHVYLDEDGQYRLTSKLRRELLKNCIFGVDIDNQAVEVAITSLSLKALEGTRHDELYAEVDLFHETVLPKLEDNIKCGNSLIGMDIFDTQPTGILSKKKGTQKETLGFKNDNPEIKKLNPFDWERSFPAVFKNGGFDCVIGNPPYGANYGKEMKHLLADMYQLDIPIADTFLMFLKRSYNISNGNGVVSFIIPSTWLYMPQYLPFREYLLKNKAIDEVQLFRKPVFEKVTVETCTIITKNQIPTDVSIYHFKEIKENKINVIENVIPQSTLLKEQELNFVLSGHTEQNLYKKIQNNKPCLADVALTVCGLTPYRLGKGKPAQNQKIVDQRAFDADYKKDDTYRKYLMGRDFNKYTWQIEKERWLSYGNWLAEPRYKAPFDDLKKIVIRQTSDRLIAHIDTNKYLSLKNVHNLRITNDKLEYEYLLSLLNSKLLDWWYQKLIPEKGRVFAEVKVVNLEKLPIRMIDFANPDEVKNHDQLVALVDTMLTLNKELHQPASALTEQRQNQIKDRIAYTDRQIDQLVYQLYGLTDEEIKIVEG